MNEIKTPEMKPNPRPKRQWPGLPFWISMGLLGAVSGVLAFVPLLNLLGYEYCAALSLMVSLTAGPVAIGAARRRQSVFSERAKPGRVVLSVYLAGLVHNLSLLVLPLAIILLNMLRVPNCNITVGFWFFLLLPVATSVICTSWGTAIGLIVRRRFLGGLTYAIVWLGLALFYFFEFWVGPQMDSFNQLTGWVAGPIFDEVVEPGLALFFSRIHGLLWAFVVLGAIATFMDPHLNKLRPGVMLRNRTSLAVTGICAIFALTLWGFATQAGFGRSLSAVENVLSKTTRTAHFVIYHDPNLTKEKTCLLAKDHEFRFYQVEKIIGPQILPPIKSYVFPSADSKRRLAGAGHTQYAKPWQYSMYLNGANFPHPIMKHELTHVMAAGFGSWPFRASGSTFIWPNVGLLEGLAVAIEWPARKYDPHLWSAAQRRTGQAPDIRSLFDPLGFWSKAPRRSYILAGSFVRFLLDNYSLQRFRRAYHSGQLDGSYEKSQEQLIQEWEKYLDGLELSQVVTEAARDKFSRPSIFQRTCAHEVSALRFQISTLLAHKKFEEAAEVTQTILGYLPDDPASLQLLAEIRRQENKFEVALEILLQLVKREDLGSAHKARLRDRIADLLIKVQRPEEAKDHLLKLLAAHIDDARDRVALIKLEALEMSQAGNKVLAFLEEGKINVGTLLTLREAADMKKHWAAIWYLIGRQLYNRELFTQSIPYFKRAGQTGFSHAVLAAENLRLLILAYYHTKQHQKASELLAVIVQYPRHQGELLWATDWLERIEFERNFNACE
ncbi:MAG: tetratricopeptide repeat protein [Deltaproteobacteria bacterium]|nr:tetratricopeptide repeat protein [Deltaproteobacteria bacterium]